MNSWEIIYEYCSDHPNCTNTHCQKTVVIHGVVGVPSINLFSGKSLNTERKLTVKMNPWSIVFEKRIARRSGYTHKHTTKRTSPQLFNGLSHALSQTYAIPLSRLLGFILLAIGLGGIVGPFIPQIRMESGYVVSQAQIVFATTLEPKPVLPKSAPIVFEPLLDANGAIITPVNENFSIVIPKIGVNAPVIANVDPAKPALYDSALLQGVAHAATSFLPDGNGTVYLFSHSTSYDWFVKDLNAVFYLVKNLDRGDTIVLIYNRKRYTYKITDKKVVASKNTSYLYPAAGKRNLILQTCWPPGSTAERLLIFADLIEEGKSI